jgi:hypothetical protein
LAGFALSGFGSTNEMESMLPKLREHLSEIEIMFLIGLASLFAGLWLLHGLGLALTVSGGALIVTALLNIYLEARNV